ncbi:FkbM family methyltransferase [Candidatus Pelagibacter sp. Uisw_137]|uniref:FkbM family methyltransferase n=1 Tax=Candidatus Pelagibacter sp. Uisw_137 TaxID=3230992 RepID=UPI0039EBCF23
MLKYLKFLYFIFYRSKIFFPKKSYSLFQEDLFIKKYFKKKTKGFYIDVGCYHPLDGNNTHLLHTKGWNGINFDINLYSIKLFNFLRKKDINIHSGISKKKDKLTMYYRKEINMLNTLDKRIAKIHFRNGFKKRNVQVNTLNYFISKYFKKLEKIDFLNIDVEGGELNVLKSLNFNDYKPQLVCIEIHNSKNMYDTNYDYLKANNIYKFLINKKYKVVWHKKYSFIFERKKNDKKN